MWPPSETYPIYLKLRVSKNDKQRRFLKAQGIRPFGCAVSDDKGILATVTGTVTRFLGHPLTGRLGGELGRACSWWLSAIDQWDKKGKLE